MEFVMANRRNCSNTATRAKQALRIVPLLTMSLGRLALVLLPCALFEVSAVAMTDSKVVTVVRPNEEDPLLQAVFYHATRRGVDMQFAADAIRGLNIYIDGRTKAGKQAAICTDMTVDVLVATHVAKWSSMDSSRVLLSLQARLDDDGLATTIEHSRRVITRIQMGHTSDQILEKKSSGSAGATGRPAPAPRP